MKQVRNWDLTSRAQECNMAETNLTQGSQLCRSPRVSAELHRAERREGYFPLENREAH